MNNTCPLCLSTQCHTHVRNPKDREYFATRKIAAEILRCDVCDSLFQSPPVAVVEASSFYSASYQNYVRPDRRILSAIALFFFSRAAAGFKKRYRDSGLHVLDYGCGQGHFLKALSAIDPTVKAFGVDVVLPKEPVDGVRFETSLKPFFDNQVRFDVIRMNHVIEHLTELDNVMIQLRSLLKPGGRIIGQTPNAGHYTANLFGRFWGPLHFPYHTFLLTREGLERACERWSLKLMEFSATYQPTGWAMSLENMIKSFVSSSHQGRLPFYPLVLLASAPFTLLDYLIGLRPRNTAIVDFELKT